MLKWIEIIASFFIGKMQTNQGPSLRESAIQIFEEITFNSRKAVSLVVMSFAAAIFALGGFFISLINATTQYDRDGVISMSATFVSGLVLIALAVGAFVWIFSSAWPGMKKFKHAQKHKAHVHHREEPEHVAERPHHQHQTSSLEQALSALVMDFVKEREIRRGESAAAMSALQEEMSYQPPMSRETEMPTASTSAFNNTVQEPLH